MSSSNKTPEGLNSPSLTLQEPLPWLPAVRLRLLHGRVNLLHTLPILVLIILIAAWQEATVIFGWQSFLVPSPIDVAQALGANRDLIISNAIPTIEEAGGGFAIGSVTAILMAILFVHVRAAHMSLYPLAIAIQSIPIVAIAPILVDALGQGYESKIVMTALITFFPTLVSSVRGLQAVEPSLIDLFQSVHASTWKTLWKLRMPNALPYMFVAFRVTATLSVIGAVIAEWVGAPRGLGFLIINFTFDFRIPELWATLVASSLLALAAFVLVAIVERFAIPWDRANATGRR